MYSVEPKASGACPRVSNVLISAGANAGCARIEAAANSVTTFQGSRSLMRLIGWSSNGRVLRISANVITDSGLT